MEKSRIIFIIKTYDLNKLDTTIFITENSCELKKKGGERAHKFVDQKMQPVLLTIPC